MPAYREAVACTRTERTNTTTFTTKPVIATASIDTASTDESSRARRSPASTSTYPAVAKRSTALASDARISSRNSPNVRAPSDDARLATTMAPRARRIATPSVSMCAASESSAREPERNAVVASTTTKPTVSARATQSRPTLRAAVRRRASP